MGDKNHFERNGITSTVWNMDCMEGMAKYGDNHFDLAIVDPPYGININPNMGRRKNQRKKHKHADWDSEIPNEEYFKCLFQVSKIQIIWGGNYYPYLWMKNNHFIYWNKFVPDGVSFSKGELAWTSLSGATHQINLAYTGFRGQDKVRIHPTQKPVALYKWLLQNYAKEGDLILDTHLGSQSSRIAAYEMGFDFIGFELDEDYFREGNKRFEDHASQLKLF